MIFTRYFRPPCCIIRLQEGQKVVFGCSVMMLRHLHTAQWAALPRPSWCEVFPEWVESSGTKERVSCLNLSWKEAGISPCGPLKGTEKWLYLLEKNGFTRALNGPVTDHCGERYMGTGRTEDEQQPLCAWGKAEDSSNTDGRGAMSKLWPAGPVGGIGWPEIPHWGWSPTWAGAPCGAGVGGSWQSTAAAGAAAEPSCDAVTPMPGTAAACSLPLVSHREVGFSCAFPREEKPLPCSQVNGARAGVSDGSYWRSCLS